MPAIPFLGSLLGWGLKLLVDPIGTFKAILAFLTSPLGILVIIAGVGVVGELHGRHKANEKWQARFDSSVAAAKAVDAKAAADARAAAATQAAEADARAATLTQRIADYAEALKHRGPNSGCSLLDDDLSRLGGVPGDAVRPRSAPAPPGR